jgi:DNA-binding LacI/PurR family transcriptional regulator
MGGESAARVTSHVVAAEAGVSQATVARVFSSPDKVALATQERVRDAAARLGYVPNAIARSLKSRRTDIVGAVVPAQSEYWQNVLTTFSRRLADQGKQLLLFSFDDADHVEEALDSVEQYRLDGLVLASSTIGQEHLVRMRRPNRHVVAFNQPAASGLLPLVTVDNEAGARDLAEHVVAQGARTAAFVGTVASASTDQIRYRGAASALADHGIACPYVEAGGFSYDAGYKVAARILDGNGRPEAVMVGSDEVALGLIDGLRSAGVDVPGDVLVTGFDGLPQAWWAGYDLTTLVQPVEVLVDEALAIIFDAPGNVGQPERIVPGTLREGNTTRRTNG